MSEYKVGKGFTYGPICPDDNRASGDVVDIRDGKTQVLKAQVRVTSVGEDRYVHGVIVHVGSNG